MRLQRILGPLRHVVLLGLDAQGCVIAEGAEQFQDFGTVVDQDGVIFSDQFVTTGRTPLRTSPGTAATSRDRDSAW